MISLSGLLETRIARRAAASIGAATDSASALSRGTRTFPQPDRESARCTLASPAATMTSHRSDPARTLHERSTDHEQAHKPTGRDLRSGGDLQPRARRNRRLARITRSRPTGSPARGAWRDVGAARRLGPGAADRGRGIGAVGLRPRRGIRSRERRGRASRCEGRVSVSRDPYRPRHGGSRSARRDRAGAIDSRGRGITRPGTGRGHPCRIDRDDPRSPSSVLRPRGSECLEWKSESDRGWCRRVARVGCCFCGRQPPREPVRERVDRGRRRGWRAH